MSEVGQRELLAIIFTDAVDSTLRTASDEDHSLRILLGDLDHIRNEAAVRGGTVLKNTGDGLLISFKSAVDAVECALAIQRGFANRPAATSFQHKVGVHIGDVVKKDGDIYGNGVNTASRLVGQCPAGGVCLSSTVYELVKQKSQIGGLKLENFQLTNIEPPIGAYRLRSPDEEKKKALVPAGRSWRVGYLGVVATLLLVLGGGLISLWMLRPRSHLIAGGQSWSKDWAVGADPRSVASVYHLIGNLGVGEEMVLNCWDDDQGKGKCGLFVNAGSHDQSGQLWDLSHRGSLRNSFLGNGREVCLDPLDGAAWMGIQGASPNKISMVLNSDGRSYKLIQRGRFLSVDPARLPRSEFRVYGSTVDQGKYSDWVLRPTPRALPETSQSKQSQTETFQNRKNKIREMEINGDADGLVRYLRSHDGDFPGEPNWLILKLVKPDDLSWSDVVLVASDDRTGEATPAMALPLQKGSRFHLLVQAFGCQQILNPEKLDPTGRGVVLAELHLEKIKEEDKAILEGVVVDSQSRPVAHAIVRLCDWAVTRTDADGRYRIEGISPGSFTLRAETPGGEKHETISFLSAEKKNETIQLESVTTVGIRWAVQTREGAKNLSGEGVEAGEAYFSVGHSRFLLERGAEVRTYWGSDFMMENSLNAYRQHLSEESFTILERAPRGSPFFWLFDATSRNSGLRLANQPYDKITEMPAFLEEDDRAFQFLRGNLVKKGDVYFVRGCRRNTYAKMEIMDVTLLPTAKPE